MVLRIIIATLALCTLAKGEEVCCETIGCFSDDAPWDHVPVPECPYLISVATHMYNRDDTYYGDEVTRDYPVPVEFDPNKRTVFLVHGWMHLDIIIEWVYEMMEDILQKEDCNVFITDWDSLDLDYAQPTANTRVVGAEMAWIMEKLTSQGGQDPENMWCIGHSLGAHVCGQAGRRHKIGRITGMDPAAPLWEYYDPSIPLSPEDATLVDVLHTNTDAWLVTNPGFHAPLGHVDFYPNGGGFMPGCILDPWDDEDTTPACSHFRAVDYMMESFTSECKFVSRRRCSDYRYLPGSCWPCDEEICQVMGYDTDQHALRGVFYLETAAAEPFCEG